MPRCKAGGCANDPDDGEGWDGYCGSCADQMEDGMGYTHYWTQPRDLTPEEMGDIGASVRKIIATATDGRKVLDGYRGTPGVPLQIAGGDGEGPPQITKEVISINGKGPDLDHEAFYLPAKRELPYDGADPSRLGWAFCKTARKPYDIVVTACLTYLAAAYDFEVGSDGDVDDWDDGVKLAEEALGREFANPMITEALVA